MGGRIRSLFQDSLLTEAEGRRLATAVFLCALAATLGVLAVGWIGDADAVEFALCFLPILGLSLWLARRGVDTPSRILVCVGLLGVTTFLLATGQGVHDLAIIVYPLIVMFAGLLLGRRASLVFAVVCAACGYLVVRAEVTGALVVDFEGVTDYVDAAVLAILLLMTAGLLWYGLGSLSTTLDALRRNEAVLAEQAESLRASEARWRSLVASSPGRIVSVDRAGRVALTARRSAGDAEDSLFDLVAESEGDAVRAALEEAIDEGRPTQCEVEAREAGHYWELQLAPVEGAAGGGATAILLDVTDRRQAEEQHLRLEEQLRQSQKMEALGQLAGGVAHDLNNLLTVVAGHVSLLEESASDAETREGLREIRAAQERAAELTRQLLAFGRRQVVTPQLLDLNAGVERAAGLLGRLLDERIELVLDLAPDAGTVRVDPVQIEQVVLNLALNARDAMPDGGRLTLATRAFAKREGARSVLSVTDQGRGMDESMQAQIFEPFFTTKPRGHGTGLGLSTVYGIVTQAGGEISVQSRPGAGTRVEVALPRVAVDAAPVQRTAPTPAGAVRGGAETLLVAEDDEAARRLVVRVLGGLGYRVLAAPGARQALALAAGESDIALLVTDLVMPDLTGTALAARLRAERGRLPVLFVSGWAEDLLDPEDPENTPCEFLQKPFAPEALARAVRSLLDANREPARA